jgi:hypothetical protein
MIRGRLLRVQVLADAVAAASVEEFRPRLRDEVHLDAVRADRLAVVHGTVQPAGVGLWLRDGTR